MLSEGPSALAVLSVIGTVDIDDNGPRFSTLAFFGDFTTVTTVLMLVED